MDLEKDNDMNPPEIIPETDVALPADSGAEGPEDTAEPAPQPPGRPAAIRSAGVKGNDPRVLTAVGIFIVGLAAALVIFGILLVQRLQMPGIQMNLEPAAMELPGWLKELTGESAEAEPESAESVEAVEIIEPPAVLARYTKDHFGEFVEDVTTIYGITVLQDSVSCDYAVISTLEKSSAEFLERNPGFSERFRSGGEDPSVTYQLQRGDEEISVTFTELENTTYITLERAKPGAAYLDGFVAQLGDIPYLPGSLETELLQAGSVTSVNCAVYETPSMFIVYDTASTDVKTLEDLLKAHQFEFVGDSMDNEFARTVDGVTHTVYLNDDYELSLLTY